MNGRNRGGYCVVRSLISDNKEGSNEDSSPSFRQYIPAKVSTRTEILGGFACYVTPSRRGGDGHQWRSLCSKLLRCRVCRVSTFLLTGVYWNLRESSLTLPLLDLAQI